MRFYKLELINREQSFNSMFGQQPQVGLLPQVGVANAQPKKGGAVKPMERKVTQKI